MSTMKLRLMTVLILIMTKKITMLMKVITCKPSLSAIPFANFWCELPLNDRVQTSSPLNCNHRYYHHWYQYHPLQLLKLMTEATSMVTSTIPPPLYLLTKNIQMITVLTRKYHDVHSSPEKGHVGHPWSVWVGSLLRLSLCKKNTIKPIQLKDLETTITLRKAGRLLDESCNFPSPGSGMV